MDPRQPPQHPFSRNTASPYGRNTFPPSSNQSPFPPSSHPPNSAPVYSDHQRRPSDPPYYNQQRSYGRDEPPLSGSSHSRHQSASSIGHGTSMNRAMPPPSSPQQQAPQQPPHHGYGPPPPRAPPVSVGPPTSFPSGRDLPSLPPLGRPQSTGGSSMSISSMLGGPPSASREPASSQYVSPINTSAPPNSMYPGPAHASPRTTASDYAPFRRPQTPEHQRSYETRDHRANSAGSPPGVGQYTPEARRFGTPQTYGQRPPIAEERREPVRVPNPNSAIPPRPNSQPERAFSHPPPRISDNSRPPIHNENIFSRRVETAPRAPEPLRREEPPYQRPGYDDRHNPAYAYAERERQERETAIQRERDLREREQQEREINERNRQQEYAHQLAQRNTQSAYSRPPEREPREQPAWMRYDAPRTAYEQQVAERPPQQSQSQATNGYDYPATTGPQYGGHPAYAPNDPRDTRDPRYPPSSSMPPQHSSMPASQYEASIQERQRQAQQERERLERLGSHAFVQQVLAVGGPQNGSYQPYESSGRRPMEESQQMQHQQQRSFLGVQEINRKGRLSPLPQAVQGAQGQLGGPGGEPGIKNEFGRMFSGIGSGVGSSMGVPSPVAAGPQSLPFSNSGQLRREDLEGLAGQESPLENGGQQIPRTASRGGRRRKLKEEDSRGDDESSTGRRTPSGRGKRAKTHHNHGTHRHHHHHHRPDTLENTSSPSQSSLTPFKSIKGTSIPSPPGLEGKAVPVHHHHIQRHHHHPPAPPVAKPQVNPVIPLRRTTVRSKAVLESVAHLPRKHLGSTPYTSDLKAGGRLSPGRTAPSRRGFESTSRPLPRFEGDENCTFTVKVPRVYLSAVSREEITRRRAVWGTDVYSDDSDVIAACIHQGWFRGEWPEDVDVSLLDLELDDAPAGDGKKNIEDILLEPPAGGPWKVPKNYDLHVTILVLPQLEKYSSTTRFGMKSREWGGKHDGYQGLHDGLSFMIHSVQWIEGVDGNEARSGVARRRLLADDPVTDMEAGESFGEVLMNGSGNKLNGNANSGESFERGGDDTPLAINGIGDIIGIGTGSWWKKPNGVPKPGIMDSDKEKAKEVDKENEQAREIEMVTEKMIENANSQAPTVIAAPVEVADGERMETDGDVVKNESVGDERGGDEIEMSVA